MKKIYSKVLVSAFVAASSFFGAQAEEVVVLQENFDKLETAMEAGVHKYGKNPWTGKDVEGVRALKKSCFLKTKTKNAYDL